MTALLILAAVTVAVTAAVLALLWWRDWQIDHIGDCFDFEPTDLDAGVFDGPEPLPHRRNGEP